MDKDAESAIREWLAEYKSLPESSIHTYAGSILDKTEVLDALIRLFETCHEESVSGSINDLAQPVCHQLFEFYRSGITELKRFAINIFPSVVFSHIVSCSTSADAKSTDALILSIYALENETDTDSSDDGFFGLEIPQLAHSSIYHNAMSGIFSEQTLNIQSPGRRYYQRPISPSYNSIIPSNRFQILTQIMNIYYKHIALLSKSSCINLCESCTYLASSGYPWQDKYLKKSMQESHRYPLSIEFMLKMLRCIYFVMYNGELADARAATEAMQRRAKKEMIPQVIFLCNAILNTVNIESNQLLSSSELQAGEGTPYGLLSTKLTPMLTRESSKKGNRWAATAKSIRDHKWRHRNEEISGDLSTSLENPELQNHPPKIGQTVDTAETSKFDNRSTVSPTKLIKGKLKKSAAGLSNAPDKIKSPAPSSGDRKNKKSSSSDKVTEEQGSEKAVNSSSQQKDIPLKKTSPTLLRKTSKNHSMLQKNPSLDEASMLSTNLKFKSVSVSKSSSDVARSTINSKALQSPCEENVNYAPNDTSESLDTSMIAFIDGGKHDTSSESECQDRFSDDKSKEQLPLLPTSTKLQNITTQQTAF